jgi:hypothetical protein
MRKVFHYEKLTKQKEKCGFIFSLSFFYLQFSLLYYNTVHTFLI